MTINKDYPTYPVPATYNAPGLTKYEYMVGQALQGLLANGYWEGTNATDLAAKVYELALAICDYEP